MFPFTILYIVHCTMYIPLCTEEEKAMKRKAKFKKDHIVKLQTGFFYLFTQLPYPCTVFCIGRPHFFNLRWAAFLYLCYLQQRIICSWSNYKNLSFTVKKKLLCWGSCVHCPKSNPNFSVKTAPVSVWANATEYIWFQGQIYVQYVSKQKPDKDRCIRSIRDGLGFCAESQIIFGTVWQRPAKGCI